MDEQVKEAQYALRLLRVLPQEPQRVHRDRRRHQHEYDQEQERVHDQGLRGDRKRCYHTLCCTNHVLNEFYNVFGVTGEYYIEENRNGNRNTENQESEAVQVFTSSSTSL